MRPSPRLAALAVVLLAACEPASPRGPSTLWAPVTPRTDATAWTMFQHDAMHTGSTPVAARAAPQLVGRFRTGGEIGASAVIGPDSTVYVGSGDGKVYAIDGHTGQARWTFATFAPIGSSPALAQGGTLYVTSVDRHLYALRDGPLVGSVTTDDGALSSPTVAPDGMAYVGTDSGHVLVVAPDGHVVRELVTHGPVRGVGGGHGIGGRAGAVRDGSVPARVC